MAEYRLYTLNSFDAISRPPEVIECADDSEAIQKATQLLDGHAIEVWQAARVVVRLEPKQKSDVTQSLIDPRHRE